MIKSVKSLAVDIMNIIKMHHNYSLPEITQINIDDCSTEYLSWLIKETKQQMVN